MGPGPVIPPLPPGFTLDAPIAASPPTGVPPLPPGFTVDMQPDLVGQASDELMGAIGDMEFPQNGVPVAPPPQTWQRGLQVGLQGAGRGVADLFGTPVDLTTLGLNAGMAIPETIANLFLSPESEIALPRITNPVGGGDWIADLVGSGYESLGGDLLDYEDMNNREQLAYNVNRYGTSAGVGGAGLAKAAAKRGADLAPRAFDSFLRPYSGPQVGKTLVADTAGGVGSGAALTAAEEVFPDNEWAQFIAMLGGGVAGAGTAAATLKADDILTSLSRFAPDPNIPYARGSLVPTSKRVADTAARVVQGQATNPAAAAARIGERASLARQYGEPMPTSGIASDDIGLIGLERGLRQQPSNDSPSLRRQFLESDQAIKEAAADDMYRLLDPDADQAAGLQYAKDRPKEIAAERDAAALPILRQAEAADVDVDTQAVVDAIEGTLSEAKRPAVRSAMTEARKMLNKPGTEEIDTSVKGLYETRKAINDIIEGRTESPTGRYARKELIGVRDALDTAIGDAVPEYRKYLDTYRQGSRPLDVFEESKSVSRMVESDTDLRNTASRLLTGNEYGRDQAMKEINSVVGNDPEAKRAWRAAVSEVLADRVQSTRRGDELSVAQVRKVWDQHRDTLAGVFSPEDMKILERTHDMLEPLQNLAQQSVPGSATIDNSRLSGMVEGAILAATGNAITAGMVMKRIRVVANLIPGLREQSMNYKTSRVIERMMFDPDLTRHLLERPLSEGTGALWNGRLRNIIAGSELSRGLYSDEPDKGGAALIGVDDSEEELNRIIGGWED